MANGSRYPEGFRERAVRLVFERQREYSSQSAAITSICQQLGVNHETLRIRVRRAEANAGERAGPTTAQLEEVRRLRKENAELRRANEILKATSAFFAKKLDQPRPR
jgi:transposase